MNDKCLKHLDVYPHSIPIIQSHLEGQYESELFYDEEADYGILLTMFDYHFVFGQVPNHHQALLDVIRSFVHSNDREELILFAPDESWDALLKDLIGEINGTIDQRVLYYLNEDVYNQFDTTNEYVRLELKNETGSARQYPQASVYLNDHLISFARAPMLGKGEAELDVWTDKQFRQKGFGFDSSITLIEYLLRSGIKPNWSCWKEKELSNMLAQKLGFELYLTYPAYVWAKEFGDI